MGSALLLGHTGSPSPLIPPGVPQLQQAHPARPLSTLHRLGSPTALGDMWVQIRRNILMPGAAWIPWAIQIFQTLLNGIFEQGGLPHNQGQTDSCLPTFSEESAPPTRCEEGREEGSAHEVHHTGDPLMNLRHESGSAHRTDQPGRPAPSTRPRFPPESWKQTREKGENRLLVVSGTQHTHRCSAQLGQF